jgi:Protein of unknown function (DUF2281)
MTIVDKIYEKLKAAPPEVAREVLDFLEMLEAKRREELAEKPKPESFNEFFGVLKKSKIFSGDPVEIQRKLRDEWS